MRALEMTILNECSRLTLLRVKQPDRLRTQFEKKQMLKTFLLKITKTINNKNNNKKLS